MSKNNKKQQFEESFVEIQHYPESLIREHPSNFDDGTFLTLSFRFRDKWASFILDESEVEQSMRSNGQVIPGRINISLGDPDEIRNVSIQEDGGEYVNQPMYNKSIYAEIMRNRRRYLEQIVI